MAVGFARGVRSTPALAASRSAASPCGMLCQGSTRQPAGCVGRSTAPKFYINLRHGWSRRPNPGPVGREDCDSDEPQTKLSLRAGERAGGHRGSVRNRPCSTDRPWRFLAAPRQPSRGPANPDRPSKPLQQRQAKPFAENSGRARESVRSAGLSSFDPFTPSRKGCRGVCKNICSAVDQLTRRRILAASGRRGDQVVDERLLCPSATGTPDSSKKDRVLHGGNNEIATAERRSMQSKICSSSATCSTSNAPHRCSRLPKCTVGLADAERRTISLWNGRVNRANTFVHDGDNTPKRKMKI